MSKELRTAEKQALLLELQKNLPLVALTPLVKKNIKNLEIAEYEVSIPNSSQVIGMISLVTSTTTKVQWFNCIKLEPEFRSKGYGLALYINQALTAIQSRYAFRNDPHSVTESAKKIWTNLANQRIATIKEDFQEVEPNRFCGWYQV